MTIDDVVYVINSGVSKTNVYDEQRNVGVLQSAFVSRANNTQRKGRAGRCQEGVCIHLFSKFAFFEEFKEYQVPEIL